MVIFLNVFGTSPHLESCLHTNLCRCSQEQMKRNRLLGGEVSLRYSQFSWACRVCLGMSLPEIAERRLVLWILYYSKQFLASAFVKSSPFSLGLMLAELNQQDWEADSVPSPLLFMKYNAALSSNRSFCLSAKQSCVKPRGGP